MTQYIRPFLELGFDPDNSRKHQIVNSIPKELTTVHNGKPVGVRELLQAEGINATTLIQTEVLSTVIEGSQPAKCWRDILPIFRTTSNSIRVPVIDAGRYAPDVAEGAEIPIDITTPSATTFTIKKTGVRPAITREMIEDGLVDVIALELGAAGLNMENKFNQDCINTILANCTTTYDCATVAATQGIKAVAGGYAALAGANWTADALVMCPGAMGRLMQDFLQVTANYAVGTTATSGILPPVLGLRSGMYGGTYTGATYTWRYTTDNDIGMLVLDSKKAGAVAMRRDMTVEQYDDPIRDLMGASVTMRYGVNYFQPTATCRILF